MEITSDSLPWSAEDEAKWNNFLSTETGHRLIPKLAEGAPLLLDGSDVNKTLVRNGELRGFQDSLQLLLGLAHSKPLSQLPLNTAYPSLEDDAAWADGQKLEPKKD